VSSWSHLGVSVLISLGWSRVFGRAQWTPAEGGQRAPGPRCLAKAAQTAGSRHTQGITEGMHSGDLCLWNGGLACIFCTPKTSAPLLKIVLQLLFCELVWVVKVCGCSAKALEGNLSISACAHILPFWNLGTSKALKIQMFFTTLTYYPAMLQRTAKFNLRA